MSERGTIMIVDDEVGPRESLRMILKPFYDIHTVGSGEEAIQYIQDSRVDLITLDLNMPGLSGLQVLREIKRINSYIEVVIITGYGTLSNAKEALRYGAGDFISKPFDLVDIISVISKSFERRAYNLKIKNLVKQIKDLHAIVQSEQTNFLSEGNPGSTQV